MSLIINDKCTKCGICVRVCPAYIISLESGTPQLINNNCIMCGHCEAICPNEALLNTRLDHNDDVKPVHLTDFKIAEGFLRSRRSIRCFKKDIVNEYETVKLLNIGRYAQTGGNSQGVSYIVITKPEIMSTFKQLTYDFYKSSKDPAIGSLNQIFSTSDHDYIFRDAPMCILALTEKDNIYTRRNAQFSLTYIELYAHSLGLGTCWAGYLERYTGTDSKEVRELLKIPENLIISGALLYGYPEFDFKRTTSRKPLNIYWR